MAVIGIGLNLTLPANIVSADGFCPAAGRTARAQSRPARAPPVVRATPDRPSRVLDRFAEHGFSVARAMAGAPRLAGFACALLRRRQRAEGRRLPRRADDDWRCSYVPPTVSSAACRATCRSGGTTTQTTIAIDAGTRASAGAVRRHRMGRARRLADRRSRAPERARVLCQYGAPGCNCCVAGKPTRTKSRRCWLAFPACPLAAFDAESLRRVNHWPRSRHVSRR